jgi:V/A-type H+/Na+-transporting ATPase subunit I
MLNSEIMRIEPFGDFSKDDLLRLEQEIHRYFQFLTIKKTKKQKAENIPKDLIYINSAYDLDYYIAINHERKNYPKMIEIFIEEPISILKQKKTVLEKRIEQAHKEIKELSLYLPILKKELIKELNISNLNSARKNVFYPIEDNFFVVSAWIAENKIENLKDLIKTLNVNFEEIAIEKTDRVPTYMENKNYSKLGEDLVNIYDVPAIEDKDPSSWVLIFFSIFFAMIVSDAGYGLLYFILALFLKFKLKQSKPVLKRFSRLVMVLSVSTMIWGALNGSFFGASPSVKSEIGKFTFINYVAIKKANYHLNKKDDVYESWIETDPKAKDATDGADFLSKIFTKAENGKLTYSALEVFKDNILMEVALLMGVFHISISFLRYLKRNFAGFGWVLFMIGGYLFFPSILNATSLIHFLNILDKPACFFIGKILLFAGLFLAVFLSFIQKKIIGAIEITKSISVFGDVLSYLRLYALGLAGMIMASTFNDLAINAGVFLGIFIVILGHLINIVLAIMSGVIHGLRLNFIEWYHYSFDGDGKLFNPLRLFK